MRLPLSTANGELHGCINIITNNVPFDDFKHMTPQNKAKLEKEKKEDSRMVKVEYINRQSRHERLEKHYCKYSGDPIEQWRLIPGYVYELPKGFVDEVNDKSKIMKKRSGLQEIDGSPVQKNGAPLDSDQDGEWQHKLIPVGF